MCPTLEHRSGSKIRIYGDVDTFFMYMECKNYLVLGIENGNELVQALNGQTGFTQLTPNEHGMVNGYKSRSVGMFPEATLKVTVKD